LQEQELQKHLEQVIRISALLGIRPEQLVERLREALDKIAAKEVV
jgi:hypothetical protein